MNFFFRKKDDTKENETTSRYSINLSGRPYNQYQDRDATIKLWLPEHAKKKIDEVCSYIDTTASDFIRQILFVHMYGRADFLALMQTKHPSVVDSHIERGIRYSVSSPSSPSGSHQSSPASAPTPPKNEASYKVHVPAKFKVDLEQCATYRKHSISSYSRQVILTHLYGYLPYDHELFGEHPPVGIDED